MDDTLKREEYAAISKLGGNIDRSLDCRDASALRCHLVDVQALHGQLKVPELQSLLLYYEANIESELGDIETPTPEARWAWSIPRYERALLLLRQAYQHVGFASLHSAKQAEILTNLAGKLKLFGRFVEAIECYYKAIDIAPNNSMHLGNLGGLLHYYRNLLHQEVAAEHYLHAAYSYLKSAIQNNGPDLYELPRTQFVEACLDIESRYLHLRTSRLPLVQHEQLSAYEVFCLSNALYLNVVTDLGEFSAGMGDSLLLPPIFEALGSKVRPHGNFNQIKLRYVAARYSLWRYRASKLSHPADERVELIDTLDSPAYGIRFEDLRTSFSIAYSLFDQIAYFLSKYLGLNCKKTVYFKNIWYKQQNVGADVDLFFEQTQNVTLRGLYWLSRDLADGPSKKSPGSKMHDALEPEAKSLALIRNELEHNYLKLHTTDWTATSQNRDDPLGFHVSLQEFEAKTLKLLKLARAAIIYTVLAVRYEEIKKERAIPEGRIVSGNPLVLYRIC